MKRPMILLAAALSLALCVEASAGGKGGKGGGSSRSSGSSRSRSYSPGTGSKSSHTTSRGYTRKNGTHVDSYKRSTPDKTINNNYTTKGNTNPHTGKSGTRVTPR
jgi:hypothetical protein